MASSQPEIGGSLPQSPLGERAAESSGERGSPSACDLIREAQGPWGKPSRGWRRMDWLPKPTKPTNAKNVSDPSEEYPSQCIQLLRVLATLTVYFPERADRGFHIEEIVAIGMVLYPGSSLFVKKTKLMLFPSTKLVEAKVGNRSCEGLSGSGYIILVREKLKGPGSRPRKPCHVTPSETCIALTPKGAQVALQNKWTPMASHLFKAKLEAAHGQISLGVIRYK